MLSLYVCAQYEGIDFMKYAKRIGYVTALVVALINSTMLNAQSIIEENKTEAQIRWEATSPIANLYLKDAPASEFIKQGDQEKLQWNNYAGALMYYLAATDRDRKNLWGPYQAAGSLAYLDVPEKAKIYLKEADKRGFWQYIIAEEDTELGDVKNTSEYKRLVANAKKRYATHAKDVGHVMLHIPKGNVPKGGWPVLIWLSGYGTEGSDSMDLAQILVGEKAIFIGINGTEKLDDHRFRWSRTDTTSTHEAIHRALVKAKKKAPLNWEKIGLIGFSQGALHSAHLIATYPKIYCGAILLSPAGKQKEIKNSAPVNKRIILSYGNKEPGDDLNLDYKLNSFFAPKNHLKISTHEGGHFFDERWKNRYPGYVDYILDINDQ